MSFNPYHLKKAELLVYLTGSCKHRIRYLSEPSCFEHEILNKNREIKIGIFDIETFGLSFNADGSIMLCYSIKEYHRKKYYDNYIKYKDLKNNLDKTLIKQLVNDLKNFNVLITYNGEYFDLPFVRTRALMFNIPFIPYGDMKSIDIYKTVRNKLKFHRSSLKVACKNFHINGKTEIDFMDWIKAISGNKKFLKDIVDHNKHDVDITEKLFDKIIIYERKINRSI